jgi:endonuclease/exonuclease/phosphatase family metal-dependent hydrolase
MHDPVPINVATWNLLHTDLEHRDRRIAEAVAHLRAAAPDIILIQEAVVRTEPPIDAAAEVADALGMAVASRATTGFATTPHSTTRNRSDTAVLARWPSIDRFEVSVDEDSSAAGATIKHPTGRPIVALSAHLPWGGRREGARLAAAQALEVAAAAKVADLERDQPGTPAPLVVLGGDFNALPSSSTVRYLTGQQPALDGSSAFWVDAWATARGEEVGATIDPSNPWVRWTALNSGASDPSALPARRIDYLMVRDWVYGRFGHPERVELLGVDALTGAIASDHYGLVVELAADR